MSLNRSLTLVRRRWHGSRTGRRDCPLCEGRIDQSAAAYDEILRRDKLINVLPDLAPLCPGHLLASSREHVLSMAQLGQGALERIEATLTELCGKLAPEFGDYFLFEHGTPPPDASAATSRERSAPSR